jgi:hypothetical protein
MTGRRGRITAKPLRLAGASLLALGLLTLATFALCASPCSAAAAGADDLWFTVYFMSGHFTETTDGVAGYETMGAPPLVVGYFKTIDVYKSGRAHAELKESGPNLLWGGDQDVDFVFEGQYDKKDQTLSGTLEYSLSWTGDDGRSHSTDESSGTLEGVLKYSTDQMAPTAFTITGDMNYSGESDYQDFNDAGNLVDSSHHVYKVEYEFVAHGDTGTEEPGGETGTVEPGGGTGTEEPGGETHVEGDEGGKIPGPESWWDWLKGTVIPGAVTVGVGLIGLLFGGVSGAPPSGPWTPPEGPALTFGDPGAQPGGWGTSPSTLAPGTDTAAGTVDPFSAKLDPYQGRQTLFDTFGNTFLRSGTDLERLKDHFFLVTYETGDSIWSGLTNTENWQKAKDWLADGFKGAIGDPGGLFEGYVEATKDGAKLVYNAASDSLKALANDPMGPLRDIAEGFGKAMDPNLDPVDRVSESTWATLNAVGLLEGGLMLKNIGKEGLKKALGGGAKGLAKAGTKSGEDAAKLAAKAAKAAKLTKAQLSPFAKPAGATKGSLEKLWSQRMGQANKNVKAWTQALNSPDAKTRLNAVLKVQKDPLSVQTLNKKLDEKLVRTFKESVGNIQNKAMDKTRAEVAARLGVPESNIRPKRVTNPQQAGEKLKAGMDQDFTIQIKGENGEFRDLRPSELSSKDAQAIYDKHFYDAAGRPPGTTAEQLSRDCRNVHTTGDSAEAWGLKQDDFDKLTRGEPTSHPDTIVKTMEYKANEAFRKADELFAMNDRKGALAERFLGQRETVKAYRNQIKARVDFLTKGGKDLEMVQWTNKKLAGVKGTVEEMDRMIGKGASPVQIDDFLRSRHTTSEELAKQVADTYGALTP